METTTEEQKFQRQRQMMPRNMEIVEMWYHRYQEGKKPVTLADIAAKYNLSRGRIYAIISRYGKK